ncbi:H-NS family nucleoid-associated regulatory protein [Caballeronia zhejiangensis]|uniref:H-NS histone family protein n=1 Tax=Caballeronia zhejiangensis TaxID=871203 RepID=UPI0015891A00|nr:H-NS histone family protein [Caballeronia zhejiangensis]
MSKSNYLDLLAQKAELQRQIDSVLRAERNKAIERIRADMETYDISVRDLSAPRNTRTPVTMKYRDPLSGKEWSGRGKPPVWIIGKDRSQYLI